MNEFRNREQTGENSEMYLSFVCFGNEPLGDYAIVVSKLGHFRGSVGGSLLLMVLHGEGKLVYFASNCSVEREVGLGQDEDVIGIDRDFEFSSHQSDPEVSGLMISKLFRLALFTTSSYPSQGHS